jgi:hypothetical protein
MSEQLIAAVGQSLLAIGLYTVSFESMVFSFRRKMYGYLQEHDNASLGKFMKACNTADNTFKFCTPKLVTVGILESAEVDKLNEMRKRRNKFAHEGYNEIASVTVADVEGDVKLMLGITRKVEAWKNVTPAQVGRTISASVSPAIFGFYLGIATNIASSSLLLKEPSIST